MLVESNQFDSAIDYPACHYHVSCLWGILLHYETSGWPPSMSYVAPVSAVLLMM
jgi:hypothetical protein